MKKLRVVIEDNFSPEKDILVDKLFGAHSW